MRQFQTIVICLCFFVLLYLGLRDGKQKQETPAPVKALVWEVGQEWVEPGDLILVDSVIFDTAYIRAYIVNGLPTKAKQ